MLLKDCQYAGLTLAFPSLSISSIQKMRADIESLAGISAVAYDCCVNSCILYYAHFADEQLCPYCSEPRLDKDGQPRLQCRYIPLTPRLLAMYLNRDLAKLLQTYRDELTASYESGKIRDIFDGENYQELLNRIVEIEGELLDRRYFADVYDIALGISMDGFCPFTAVCVRVGGIGNRHHFSLVLVENTVRILAPPLVVLLSYRRLH
jgi:hypothetical protein